MPVIGIFLLISFAPLILSIAKLKLVFALLLPLLDLISAGMNMVAVFAINVTNAIKNLIEEGLELVRSAPIIGEAIGLIGGAIS
jgi:hypothetical protein